MSRRSSIGIIGGTGWIGRALAQRITERGFVDPGAVVLSSRSGGPDGDPTGVRWTRDNQELAACCDAIVIAVRPEQFSSVAIAAPGRLVISVMAGVSAATIAERTRARAVVRAMPNAAITIARSYTPWFATAEVSDDDRRFVQAMFETCGTADEVPKESDIDYFVGLTGSGPAFPALLAKAMMAHAVSKGIEPGVARRAVQGVVVAASQLLASEGCDPSDTVRTFLDYRGTTAAALQAMIDHGFTEAVHAGLRAAEMRAAEMAASAIRS